MVRVRQRLPQTVGGFTSISGQSLLVNPSGRPVGSAPIPIRRGGGFTPLPKPAPTLAEDVGQREKNVRALTEQGLSEAAARRQVSNNLGIQTEQTLQEQAVQQKASEAEAVKSLQSTPNEQVQAREMPGSDGNAAIAASIPAIVSAGVAGGGIGTAIAPGIGTTVGAVVASVSVVIGKISLENRENVGRAFQNYTDARKNLARIVWKANHDPTYSVEQAMADWRDQLEVIDLAEANLKFETRNSFASYLSGGRNKLQQIQNFKDDGNGFSEEAFLRDKLFLALSNPDPNAVLENQFQEQ